MSKIRYTTPALILCLLVLNAALCGAEKSSCNFKLKDIKQQCYNPAWCSGVLSVRECSDRPHCCRQLHTKIDCLTDMLDEQTGVFESLNLSLEKLDNLSDDLRAVQSQYNNVQNELENLSKKSKENGNTATEIRERVRHIDVLNDRFDSLHRSTKEFESTFIEVEKEISHLTRRNLFINEEIESLKQELALTQQAINASTVMTESQNDKIAYTAKQLLSVEKRLIEFQTKLDSINTEMAKMQKKSYDTDGALNSLSHEVENATKNLKALEQLVKTEQMQNKTKLTEIPESIHRYISKSERKMSELLRHETNTLDRKLHTLDDKWSYLENRLNTSFTQVKATFDQYKTEATRALDKTTIELKAEIRNFEIRLQTLGDVLKEPKYENIEGDIERQTERIVQQMDKTIQQNSDEFNRRMSEFSRKHEGINAEIDDLSKSLRQVENDIKRQLETEIRKLKADVEYMIEALDSKLNKMPKNIESDISKTNEKISEIHRDIEKYKLESEHRLTNTKNDLTSIINRKLEEVHAQLSTLDERVEKRITSLNEAIGWIRNEVEKLKRTEEVNGTVKEQKQRVDLIYPNVLSKEIMAIAFFLLVILVAINYLIVYNLVKRTSHSDISATNTPQAERAKEEPHSPIEVFNRLHFPKLRNEKSIPLLNSVSVISFDEDSQKHHMHLIRSVVDNIPERLLPEVDIEYHMVRRHEHIPDIPRSKICIMFVEYSEG